MCVHQILKIQPCSLTLLHIPGLGLVSHSVYNVHSVLFFWGWAGGGGGGGGGKGGHHTRLLWRGLQFIVISCLCRWRGGRVGGGVCS